MLDLAVLLAAAAQVDAGAVAQSGTEAWQAPTLTIVRYDEHWDRLADPSARDDHWTDPFKYIPIGDGGAYLTTGLELRARREAYRDNLWGGAAAPDALRIHRTMQRDGIGRDEVIARMNKQIKQSIKMRLCDFVIVNDEQQAVIPQVMQLHERLLELAGAKTAVAR